MNDLQFKCPACGERIFATAADAGRPAACPACKRPVTVPAYGALPPSPDAPPDAAPGWPLPHSPLNLAGKLVIAGAFFVFGFTLLLYLNAEPGTRLAGYYVTMAATAVALFFGVALLFLDRLDQLIQRR